VPMRVISWMIGFVIYLAVWFAIVRVIVGVHRLLGFGQFLRVGLYEGISILIAFLVSPLITIWTSNRLFRSFNRHVPGKWHLTLEKGRPEWSGWDARWGVLTANIILWTVIVAFFAWALSVE